jgi:hypothetical protein
MTADAARHDVWTHALELIGALRAHCVDVALATMGAPLSPAQAREAAALPHLEVFESTFAIESAPSPACELEAAGDWLRALAQLTRPHLAHLNSCAHAALDMSLPVVCAAHCCMSAWLGSEPEVTADPAWAAHCARCKAGLARASALVASTPEILRELLAACDAPPSSVVIANAGAANTQRMGLAYRVVYDRVMARAARRATA